MLILAVLQYTDLSLVVTGPGGVLLIYKVLQVCQHRGCVFHQKRNRKGVFFSSKCNRKDVYYSTTNLENFRRYAPLLSDFVLKMIHFGRICQEYSIFFTKKLQEKGCLLKRIVWFWRPHWHTCVQELIKCPPLGLQENRFQKGLYTLNSKRKYTL